MLDGFFLSDASPAQLLEGRSDAGLVVLSVLIAIISAAVCLRLAGVAQATKGATQQAALLEMAKAVTSANAITQAAA